MKREYLGEGCYLPELSDLFIGYECEIIQRGNVTAWEQVVLDRSMDWGEMIFSKTIRTPFLSMDHVMRGGWFPSNKSRFHFTRTSMYDTDKGNYYREYTFEYSAGSSNGYAGINTITESLNFGNGRTLYKDRGVFVGYILSMNEFRKICTSIIQ